MPQTRPNRFAGPGNDRFWAACDNGELRLQRCENCRHWNWPVIVNCEQCGKDEFSWELMSGKGTVSTWCSFVQDYYKGIFPLPHDTILVALEEGPLFLSNPQGFAFDDITPNMPVRLAFLDCQDAAGPFRLPVFEKA